MDMLFGCLHSDRTTSWNALSTSREHKYPSPLTLRVKLLFHKTPRAQAVPVIIPTLPRLQKQQSCQVNQVFLAQDAPKEASQLWGCILPYPSTPEPGWDTEMMPACSPLPGPTCSMCSTRSEKLRGLAGEEGAFPLQEFEFQSYSSFGVGTKLGTLWGN